MPFEMVMEDIGKIYKSRNTDVYLLVDQINKIASAFRNKQLLD